LTSNHSTPVVKLKHISKTFGGVKALVDVDLEIMPGEVHCLAGENGCGKSTLIKIISGVYTPDSGANISLMGKVYNKLDPSKARSLGIGVIWQDLALFPEMNVAENIAIENFIGRNSSIIKQSNNKEVAKKVCDRLGVFF